MANNSFTSSQPSIVHKSWLFVANWRYVVFFENGLEIKFLCHTWSLFFFFMRDEINTFTGGNGVKDDNGTEESQNKNHFLKFSKVFQLLSGHCLFCVTLHRLWHRLWHSGVFLLPLRPFVQNWSRGMIKN